MDLTLAQLAQYNGLNGQPAYVAVRGVIYDASSFFPNGIHHTTHHAGTDLTTAFNNKHNDNRMSGFPVIGNLITVTCGTPNCNFLVL